MKKQLLFLLITILSFNCYSQISFEKGYYIDNSNQKTNCLIKNIDWKNNPTQFEYKLSENSESKKKTIESIKEFGINNISKYVRSIVNIDRSSEDIKKLSYDRNPIFKEEKLFLKVLIEGKANLYLLEDGNLRRFFFNKENSAIEQLIFKSYKTPNNQIGKNNRFKNQLWNNLKCPNLKINKVENLSYQKNDIVDFFVEYNECNGEKNTNYEEKQKKDLFNLSIRPGFNNSSLSVQNSIYSSRDTDFDNEFGFRFGIEAEFIMPFNKNKWSLIIEPTYQYYKSEKETRNRNVKADYKSIEIPVGIRHYFFLNENSKMFVNGSFIFDFSNNSIVDYSIGTDLEIKTRNNFAFGIGYRYNDKYSLELRYQTSREVLSDYIAWSSDYNTFSVIFGYSFF
ncbi:outer membrane beta-barrel protein [Tenacibaculum soleae]|uniref:tRNA modification GTPase n=2 Tax=Tenacibaculum soleae TaxID=447689 RepID=A0A1B9XZZ0_9FLAO|nr:outer membrane beta-barrel protein [Tenacibaculum soleae]OCK43113.1 tRNA modification GTPase [Tenacibaculum soleae]